MHTLTQTLLLQPYAAMLRYELLRHYLISGHTGDHSLYTKDIALAQESNSPSMMGMYFFDTFGIDSPLETSPVAIFCTCGYVNY